jgi:hypothetical protein
MVTVLVVAAGVVAGMSEAALEITCVAGAAMVG